jgi:hypothetical protein
VICLNKLIGLVFGSLFILLFLLGCTQPEGNNLIPGQLDSNDKNLGASPDNSGKGVVLIPRQDISYTLTMIMDNGTETPVTVTNYVTKDNARLDIETPDGPGRLIQTPNGNYLCALDDESNAWTCLDFGAMGAEGFGAAFANYSNVLNQQESVEVFSQGVLTFASPRTIAGENTTCYRETVSPQKVEFCLNKRGILFYSESYDNGVKMTTTVTQYSEQPIGADVFVLPGKVTQLPTMPPSQNMPPLPEGYENMLPPQ